MPLQLDSCGDARSRIHAQLGWVAADATRVLNSPNWTEGQESGAGASAAGEGEGEGEGKSAARLKELALLHDQPAPLAIGAQIERRRANKEAKGEGCDNGGERGCVEPRAKLPARL